MYGGVHIYINVFTNKTYIYKRYIYIYISCTRVCVSLGLLQVILSGEGDVPLFVTKPVTAGSENAACAVWDRDSFQGLNDLLSWQFYAGGGCTCWRRLCISRS